MHKRLFPVYAVMMATLLVLPGCGSNSSSGGSSSSAPDSSVADGYVGTAACIECHEGFSWSAQAVEDYLDGKHVENHVISGDRDYDYVVAEGCVSCHDPLGDSPAMMSLLNNPSVMTVGCENCHGTGEDHFGIGPITDAQPGADVCGQCHNDDLPTSHLPHHPDADAIYERYAASAHAGSAGPEGSEYSTDEDMQNGHLGDRLPFGDYCIKCHTHEGSVEYLEVDEYADIQAIDDGAGNSYTSIQCKTCHDPHNAGKLVEAAKTVDNVVDGVVTQKVTESAEYNTCMNCHGVEEMHASDHGATESGKSWTIFDTHGDDPNSTWSYIDDNGVEHTYNVMEGYAINKIAEDSCTACHDAHGPINEINAQWAKSGHAAEIGLIKAEDYTAVVSMEDEDERHSVLAFLENNVALTPGRENCHRCHTTTGAENYLAAERDPDTTYNALENDFSHLEPQYDASDELISSQVELLSCKACHVGVASGALAATGSDITLDYTYDGQDIVLEGINESKICLTCHGGWGNNDSVEALTDATRDFHGVLHHGPAGAVLFADQTHAGYEFGQPENYRSTPHSRIGTTDANGNEVVPGTGTAGPCVACHMPDKNHSNAVVDIESMTINSAAVCNSCHAITAEELEDANNGRKQMADVIKAAAGVGSVKSFANAELFTIEEFRVGMNWWVVYDDFGGYAHNPTYVKQIAFDTVDYFQHDGVLTGTITIDSDLYPAAAAWMGAAGDGTVTRPN